jgi:putative nucleotidyltransferase with HDIG domain
MFKSRIEILGKRLLAGAEAPRSLWVYAAFLALATGALVAVTIATRPSLGGEPWEIALLAGIALLTERQPVRISDSTEITVSVLPILFAAVVFGPLAAMLVAAVGILVDLRPPYIRWVIWTCLRALAGGIAAYAAIAASDGDGRFPALVIAVVAAALTEAVVDVSLGAVVVAIRTGAWLEYLGSVRLVLLGTVPLYTPVLVVLAYAYNEVSALSMLLFFGPAFAAHRFYRLYEEQKQAARALESANLRLERANLSFASALVATLDARDKYTAGHSAAVAVYARDIAARMGLSDEQQRLAHLCGLVHDIGKVGLPAGLLEKAGPLTLDERRLMETHSAIGQRILEKVEDYAEIAAIVRHHHERVDGLGYPDGFRGNQIPLLSRIIAVADAYNAMTSDRPYRDAMPSRVARLRLAQAVDSQFDTAAVAAFEAILASASEDYRLAAHIDFGVEGRSLASEAIALSS